MIRPYPAHPLRLAARRPRRLLIGALITLLCLPGSALALPEDSEQPIQIQADRAELEETTGVAIYIGNVRLDQGTLRVTADRMTIHTAEERVVRVEAEGERAHYQQQPAVDGPFVQADANKIIYFLDDERVKLEGQAELTREKEYFASGVIRYNMRTGQVDASEGRVRTILSPSRQGSAAATPRPE